MREERRAALPDLFGEDAVKSRAVRDRLQLSSLLRCSHPQPRANRPTSVSSSLLMRPSLPRLISPALPHHPPPPASTPRPPIAPRSSPPP
jgi:hypothetical protein